MKKKIAKPVYHRVYNGTCTGAIDTRWMGARAHRKIWVNKEVRCLRIPISKCDGSFPRSLTSDDWRYFVSDVSFAVISSDCYLQTLVSLSSLSILPIGSHNLCTKHQPISISILLLSFLFLGMNVRLRAYVCVCVCVWDATHFSFSLLSAVSLCIGVSPSA